MGSVDGAAAAAANATGATLSDAAVPATAQPASEPAVETVEPAAQAQPLVQTAAKTTEAVVQAPAQGVQQATETVSQTAQPVVEPATQAAQPVVEIVSQAAQPVVESAQPVVETAAQAAQPVVETVSQTAQPVVETATQAAQPVVETVPHMAQPVTETVQPLAETLTSPVEPALAPLTPQVRPVLDAIQPVQPALEATERVTLADTATDDGVTSVVAARRPTSTGPLAAKLAEHAPSFAAAAAGSGIVPAETATSAAAAVRQAAETPSTRPRVFEAPAPGRNTIPLLGSLTKTGLESAPWPAESWSQPLSVRGADTGTTSGASGNKQDLPQLPSLPGGLGTAAASTVGFGFELPAAVLAALLLVALRLSRLLRLPPDLWRPPAYVSLIDRPG